MLSRDGSKLQNLDQDIFCTHKIWGCLHQGILIQLALGKGKFSSDLAYVPAFTKYSGNLHMSLCFQVG